MPKRALIERRPWLLVSIAAALAFYFLSDEQLGGLYLIALKGAACGSLAIYALLRHRSADAKLLAAVMALSAAGDVGIELWGALAGGALFLAAHLVAIALYARNRRPKLGRSQAATAVALVVMVPLVAWLVTGSAATVAYALALGAMAAAAWSSMFSRYRVGLGAVLFVASDLLIFARLGGRIDPAVSAWLVWPLYYVGQFLICHGVIRKLRRTA